MSKRVIDSASSDLPAFKRPATETFVRLPNGETSLTHRRVDKPFNPTVEGDVRHTGGLIHSGELEYLRHKCEIPSSVALILPDENQVACSDLDGFVCLYEYMFEWGFRITVDGLREGVAFLVNVLTSYHLSPGQLTPGSFVRVLAFWCMAKDHRPAKKTDVAILFRHLHYIQKVGDTGHYSFRWRPLVKDGVVKDSDRRLSDRLELLRSTPRFDFPRVYGRFFFVQWMDCPFIPRWSEVNTTSVHRVEPLESGEINLFRRMAKDTFRPSLLQSSSYLKSVNLIRKSAFYF